MRDTKERLLDSAEKLFAKQGFAASSVRQITTNAKANLAALNYHFGSKKKLISAVFSRRIGPLNVERIQLLEEYSRQADDGVPSLHSSVQALVGPALRLSHDPARGGKQFMHLMGRAFSDRGEGVDEMVMQQFEPLAELFFPVLRHHLVDLAPKEFFWRVHFMIGAMAYTMAAPHRLFFLSQGLCAMDDPEESIEQLVRFIVAGLLAPSEQKESG